MKHHVSVLLQLYANLAVDELQEGVLIHGVVEVGGHIGLLFKPGPRHVQLVLEVVTWVQHLVQGRLLRPPNIAVYLHVLTLRLLQHVRQRGKVVAIKQLRERIVVFEVIRLQVVV